MKIAVPKERLSDEMRVAASPDSIKKLSTLGFDFSIETGAGDGASFSDEALKEAGAEIVSNARAAILGSDLILKVRGPEADAGDDMADYSSDKILIASLSALGNKEQMDKLA
ncbi:MAG: NAD(P)(+) transhydrogenase (Re/Si-specific) subunit alpha, partial [Rhodospirillales bacterium]|nr:NAD(P)(+) transhydrogenase (Re/Si-specific) subunit alpha [Rhodospirillales bacterium]